MVLKNIKEIKNIEKKIIHRKISSSRYVRMIRFFLFLPVTISRLCITNLVRFLANNLEELPQKPIFIDYMWRCFDREICGKSSYSRENIWKLPWKVWALFSVTQEPPLRAWQGRLDSVIFSPNHSGRYIYSFSEFCLISQVYLSS